MSPSLDAIIRFRRRDVLVILPLTIVAALGASVWEPPLVTVAWAVVNLALMGFGQALYSWLGRQDNLPRETEPALAGYTFATTAIYSLLPAALVARGDPGAVVAGAAMLAAICLSSTSEFVASYLIGSASLVALYLAAVTGVVIGDQAERPLSLIVALIGSTCFFGYVVKYALHQRSVERGLSDALQLAEARGAEAQAANAAKSIFLATMSHEIRTPMNGVLGMAQAMAAGDLPGPQRERLVVLQESGEALLTLLNDLLDFAKIEAGKLECEQIPFDLESVLNGATAAFSVYAAQKSLVLDTTISEAARGTYRGDPIRVRQILNNLISNALKFTEAGRVDVAVSRDGELLTLAVSDTGPGMPADLLHRLFGKFQQLDASTTRKHGGSGLGLAICRELCGLMGGAITAESVVGQGSTFTATLCLPRIGAPSMQAPDADERRPAMDAANELRILAAEDNPVNRLVLKTLLAQIGVEPVLVEDGAQALAAWRDGAWDAILMDVQMPVMDGVAATLAIRQEERRRGLPRTPIIALTANAMAHQLADYRAAGMDDCVAKPIRAQELYVTLERVLGDEGGEAADGARMAASSL
jgi:two-component system, sensor histidine kinase